MICDTGVGFGIPTTSLYVLVPNLTLNVDYTTSGIGADYTVGCEHSSSCKSRIGLSVASATCGPVPARAVISADCVYGLSAGCPALSA